MENRGVALCTGQKLGLRCFFFGDENGETKSWFNVSGSVHKAARRHWKDSQPKSGSVAEPAFEAGGQIGSGGRRSSMKGRKVPVKYRDKEGNTWAGRGAQPVWMREKLKAGAKLEDFAVQKTAASRKSSPRKARKRRPKK
jgi:hypothetical protein